MERGFIRSFKLMCLYVTIYVCNVCEVLELPLKRHVFQVWMFPTIHFQVSYKIPEASNISQCNEKASSQLIVSLQASYPFPKFFWYCYVVRVIKCNLVANRLQECIDILHPTYCVTPPSFTTPHLEIYKLKCWYLWCFVIPLYHEYKHSMTDSVLV